MILTYEQADRFYTLINALLGYANERFEVVRELPLPIVDLESQSKAALVAETLWDSVGIIDDFVRENLSTCRSASSTPLLRGRMR